MTKRDIIKFLERKQQEKRTAMQDEYFARREQLLRNIYSELGLPALADKIQPLLSEARRLWEVWEKEHENLDFISFHHYYNSLYSQLDRYTSDGDSTLKMIVGDNVKINPEEVKHANKEYYSNLDRVDATFITVITTVKEMKTAKQAAAYLKELGFDLSELENPAEPMQTALMVPVDTRFLFVKAA